MKYTVTLKANNNFNGLQGTIEAKSKEEIVEQVKKNYPDMQIVSIKES